VTDHDRGQLVLLAAALVAVALAPLVLAALQLGYHEDVRATGDYDDPTADTVRVLNGAVTEASGEVPGEYMWAQRDGAITAVRGELRPTIDQLRTAEIERGTVAEIRYNASAAREWRSEHCSDGPNRQFGTCVADSGVVVQERTDRTHVLAAAFDVTTTTERGETTVTVVLRAVENGESQ